MHLERKKLRTPLDQKGGVSVSVPSEIVKADEGVSLSSLSDSESERALTRSRVPKALNNKEEKLGLQKWRQKDWVPFGLPMHLWNAWAIIYPAHILGLYGCYVAFTGQCSKNPLWNFFFFIVYGYAGGIGVTAGAHRLWTHKSYKANRALEIILMLFQTSSLQYPVIKWCRDHRIHHKYTDTDADPHSAANGFWFSHMGWVLNPEHPEVLRKEKTIPMKDLEDNPVLDFQARYYWWLVLLTVFVIPITFMYFVFPQPFFHIICINYARWALMTHIAACVNSVAHMFGDKPYDKSMSSVDNKILSIFTAGEAWHNYHHTFPWDYKTSELPFYTFNVSTAFIDFFAWLGWATELKTVPNEMIWGRARRTGDGTHPTAHKMQGILESEEESSDSSDDSGNFEEEDKLSSTSLRIQKAVVQGKVACWGWGDADMEKEMRIAERLMANDNNNTNKR